MPEFKIQKNLPIQQRLDNPDARLREAADMYEKHFLNEMVKAMRKTVEHSKLTEPSMAEKIYSENLDQEYVDKWGAQGGIGLSNLIYDQLQERFSNHKAMPQPKGPIPLDKGMRMRIDESRPQGIPLIRPSNLPTNGVSFLMEWDEQHNLSERNVRAPFSGKILQSFRIEDDRQILKLEHPEGLLSTLSFVGQTKGWENGKEIKAGETIGALSAQAKGLTWQLEQVET